MFVSTLFYGVNMNFAIEHIPISEYAYALDPHTLRLVLKVQKGEPFKEIGVLWNNKYNFAKNRNFARMKQYGSDGLYDVYLCDITSSDVRLPMSFFSSVRAARRRISQKKDLPRTMIFNTESTRSFSFPISMKRTS